jgi:hypothetical protein
MFWLYAASWFGYGGAAILALATEPNRLSLVAPLGILAGILAVTTWLYLTSGLNRYCILPDGLEIVRWRRIDVIPWSEIRTIEWMPQLHTIRVKGQSGGLFFTSTDLFPFLPQLVSEIWRRSDCEVDAKVETVLERAAESPHEIWWPLSIRGSSPFAR